MRADITCQQVSFTDDPLIAEKRDICNLLFIKNRANGRQFFSALSSNTVTHYISICALTISLTLIINC